MKNRVAVVSNIIFEPYLHTYIKNTFPSFPLDYIPYEEINERHDSLKSADIVAVCLNFEAIYPNALNNIDSGEISINDIMQNAIGKIQEVYFEIKARSKALIIWFGFEDYYVNSNITYGTLPVLNGVIDKLNLTLTDILSNAVYIDLKYLIAKVGISAAYSTKGKYRWNAPYSKELIGLMVDEVYKQYLIYAGSTKKCIVLDCDNVLWGGILSEDGIDGIQIGNSGLGRPFWDFQRFLVMMYYHGAILTVCSKNDEADILKVFREHSGMLLKEKYISCFQCNWNNKPDNIKAIADTLNIGLDSMVFIDDSHFELEAVTSLIPEVTTILYDRDTVYQKLSCFNLRSNIDISNIDKRTETYRTNIKRKELKENSKSFDEYISSLDMRLDIHKTFPSEFARVSELTQRTNKCTNGKRYTLEQIKDRKSLAGYHLYTVCLSDKFSDLGIVGVIGIYNNTIDLFALSCRALGRKIEDKMIQYSLETGVNTALFYNTQKNDTVSIFFESYGLLVENSVIK